MDKIFPVIAVVDGENTFSERIEDIANSVPVGGALRVLSALDYHTSRQRRWYKGICLRGLSDWNGETPDEWDLRLKDACNGVELLKKETIYLGNEQTCTRLTIVGVGKRNMTRFIDNILSLATTEDWPVTEPDPDLRGKKEED